MSDDALGKTIETVSTFENGNDTALREFIGKIDDYARHGRETLRRDVELAKDVIPHPIKAGTDQNEVGFEFAGGRRQSGFESFKKLPVARANRHGDIQLRARSFSSAGFRRSA